MIRIVTLFSFKKRIMFLKMNSNITQDGMEHPFTVSLIRYTAEE